MLHGEYQGEDSQYHSRHGRRSRERAKLVAQGLSAGKSFLDVGCNQGVASQYVLDAFPAQTIRATGIELSRTTVSPALLANPAFSLIEGNICDVSLTDRYDVVFYGAVHHHIVRDKGLGSAIGAFIKLVDHCNETLYFETGHLGEGPRWEWQHAIRRYFSSDEEHVFFLLRCIEDKIKTFSVVGKFLLHGAPRWLLKIELKPFTERPGKSLVHRTELRYVRTFGSRSQELIKRQENGVFSPVEFGIEGEGDSRVFIKRYIYDQAVARRERMLAQQADAAWAVKPLGEMDASGALYFPFIDGLTLSSAGALPKSARAFCANKVLCIFRECHAIRVPDASHAVLIPASKSSALIDVVDMTVNNFMYSEAQGKPALWMIDFEPHSNHNRFRNCRNIAQVLWHLREKRFLACILWLQYAAGSVRCAVEYQFKGVDQRIRDRQPAIGALLLIRCRNWIEGCLVRVFPRLREH